MSKSKWAFMIAAVTLLFSAMPYVATSVRADDHAVTLFYNKSTGLLATGSFQDTATYSGDLKVYQP